MPVQKPELGDAFDVVAKKIVDATIAASARLKELGIRHALVGGLAVGAHGWPRSTKDVDFLVGMEAYEEWPGGIISPVRGLPIDVGGVSIDNLPAEGAVLEEALSLATESEGIPVARVETIIYMKLLSPRPKDRLDVAELILSGVDPHVVVLYLESNAPELSRKFSSIVADVQASQVE